MGVRKYYTDERLEYLERECDIILTRQKLKQVAQKLKQANLISFDYEATGLHVLKDQALGIAIATDNGCNVYIPFRHGGLPTLSKFFIIDTLKHIFEQGDNILIAHNLKFDIKWLWKNGINIDDKVKNGKACCTQVMSVLENENRRNKKLEYLSKKLLNHEMAKFEDVAIGKEFERADIELGAEYAKDDALRTLQLYQYFLPRLEEDNLTKILWDIEMPLLRVLAKMENRGISVDVDLIDVYKERIIIDLENLEETLYELAGRELNLNSTQQLGRLLFPHVECPECGAEIFNDIGGEPCPNMVPKLDVEEGEEEKELCGAELVDTGGFKAPIQERSDKTKRPSCNSSSIETLAGMNDKPWSDFCTKLLRYKELSKMNSSFIEGLIPLIDVDGKLHTNLHQTRVVTGRLSSSKPNLQQMPSGATWEDVYEIGKEYKVKDLWLKPESYEDETNTVLIPDNYEDFNGIFPYHQVKEVENDEGEVVAYKVVRMLRDIYYKPKGKLVVADKLKMSA